MLRGFVRTVDPGEVLELARARLGIEALGIALLRFAERRIDENLEELAFGHHPSDHVALGTKWRNERSQQDQAGVGHDPGDLADPADVLDAIGLSETEIPVEAVADIVAVEQEGVTPPRRQL